jgi:hypothetical protein
VVAVHWQGRWGLDDGGSLEGGVLRGADSNGEHGWSHERTHSRYEANNVANRGRLDGVNDAGAMSSRRDVLQHCGRTRGWRCEELGGGTCVEVLRPLRVPACQERESERESEREQ